MNYDLPKPPDGYKTDLALIIAPYFDLWFVRRIVKQLKPRRIRFVVDDGARTEDINRLRKECGAVDINVALGRAAGIVHLKGYYLEFIKLNGPGRRIRRFLFGSANATKAAFDGETNAELLADVDLSAEVDGGIVTYLKTVLRAVENDGGAVNGIITKATGSLPRVFLPSFQITLPGPPPGFDAWLQRGNLAAKYRDPQQFIKIPVRLKKPLPQGAIAQLFATQRLIPRGSRDIVRYSYIDSLPVEDEDEEASPPQWKARYCVWTHLGDWLSEECYDAKRDSLISKTKRQREVWIERLIENGSKANWINARKQSFLQRLDRIWNTLDRASESPRDYFESRTGQINRSHYGTRFADKLEADFRLARDPSFRDRYVNGYEFPDVPRFRQDTVAWHNFVRSWCETVALEAAKTGTRSLITKALRAALEPSDLAELKADEIRDKLRDTWNTVGDRITRYFEWEGKRDVC